MRYGKKNGWKGKTEQTILLKNIRDAHGILVSDHLWFNQTKGFAALELKDGDVVQFKARVKEYEKGYKGRREDELFEEHPMETDYKLSNPTDIKKKVEKRIVRLPKLPKGQMVLEGI